MLLPVLVFGPMLGAIVTYAIGRRSKPLRDAVAGIVGVLTLAGALMTWGKDLSFTLEGFCGLGLHFRADGFRSLYAAVAAFMWALSGLFSPDYFAHYHNRNRYYFFNLLTLGATLGVFLSDDLYTTFIFFEIMSLTSYTWVAQEETAGALKASGTYLTVAVIGGLTTLMGLFMLWHDLGTLSFAGLRQIMSDLPAWCASQGVSEEGIRSGITVSSWLVLFGFAAKAGLFPLHIWLPKAHPVAPAPASALLSGILTKSGVFGIIVLCADLRMNSAGFGTALLILACVTMFAGAVLALFSVDLKRTLACSSMSQIGFITVGLSTMVLLGDEGGLAASGALMHMVNHSLIKLCLFMCAGVVYMNLHKLDLNDIRGFGRRKPLLHIIFLLGALSIACIPPLGSGYLSKSLIHEGMLEYIHLLKETGGSWQWVKGAEILFLISGGLTIAYMLKLYICIFWQKNTDHEIQQRYDEKKPYARPLSLAVLLLSSLVLVLPAYLPDTLFAPFIRSAMGFFGQEMPGHIHWYSAENLLGAAKSLGIGLLIYLVIVRRLLMGRDGRYLDRWPARLDLQSLIYRPLIMNILPNVTGMITRLVAGLPEWIALRLPDIAGAVTRFMAELPEWIVLGIRNTVFRKSVPVETVPIGNRLTYGTGKALDRLALRLNKTVCRRHPLRTDREITYGKRWESLKQQGERMSLSLSYGLLLMAVGLLATCVYLLLT